MPEAIAELQEAARLEPASGEAHYQLGLALARAGRKEEAAAELEKGRELVAADDRARNAELDVAEGRAALQRGDRQTAAAKLRHALQLQPDSAEAKRLLAAMTAAPAAAAAARTSTAAAPPPPLPPRTTPRGRPSSKATFARAGSPRSSRCSPST